MSVPPPNFLEWDDNEIPAGYRVIIIRLINYFKDVRKGDPVPEGIEVVFGNESQVPLFYRVKPNLIQIIHNMANKLIRKGRVIHVLRNNRPYAINQQYVDNIFGMDDNTRQFHFLLSDLAYSILTKYPLDEDVMEYAMQMDSKLLCGINVPIEERERRRIVDHYMLTKKSNKDLRKPRGGMKSRDLYNELNRINPIRRNITYDPVIEPLIVFKPIDDFQENEVKAFILRTGGNFSRTKAESIMNLRRNFMTSINAAREENTVNGMIMDGDRIWNVFSNERRKFRIQWSGIMATNSFKRTDVANRMLNTTFNRLNCYARAPTLQGICMPVTNIIAKINGEEYIVFFVLDQNEILKEFVRLAVKRESSSKERIRYIPADTLTIMHIMSATTTTQQSQVVDIPNEIIAYSLDDPVPQKKTGRDYHHGIHTKTAESDTGALDMTLDSIVEQNTTENGQEEQKEQKEQPILSTERMYQTKLDMREMQVVAKYINRAIDLVNMEKTSKKYRGLFDSLRYNTVPLYTDNEFVLFKKKQYYHYNEIDDLLDLYTRADYEDLIRRMGTGETRYRRRNEEQNTEREEDNDDNENDDDTVQRSSEEE